MLTPTFENVAGGKYKIDNFVVSGSGDGQTVIQALDNKGAVVGVYYWYNEFDDGSTVWPAGWFEFGGEVPAGITLNPGDCVIFNNDEAGTVNATFPSAL